MLEGLGPDASGLGDALSDGEPTLSVRLNGAKGAVDATLTDVVPWCPQGRYLPERPLFAADPHWHQGMYYVQEASSMAGAAAMAELVEASRRGDAPLRVLDACAAPGGKTIGILESLNAGDFVVANEADARRCNILLDNLGRYGAANIAVTRGDACVFASLPETFDIVAADVPCSGEGMMRKEAVAVQQWSPALVRQCAQLQQRIVDALWTVLRPGGYMLYSTCTFNTTENEENILRLIAGRGAVSVRLRLSDMPGVAPAALPGLHACRFYPGRVRGEGLFLAALRKPAVGSAENHTARRARGRRPVRLPEVEKWLKDPEIYVLSGTDTVYTVPRGHAEFAEMLERTVRTVRPGLPVAVRKGREYAPTHELALSTIYSRVLPMLSLDNDAARAYLRGDVLTDLPAGFPRGYFTPAYAGVPLGLAKCVGARANNLYPAPQRLRDF